MRRGVYTWDAGVGQHAPYIWPAFPVFGGEKSHAVIDLGIDKATTGGGFKQDRGTYEAAHAALGCVLIFCHLEMCVKLGGRWLELAVTCRVGNAQGKSHAARFGEGVQK